MSGRITPTVLGKRWRFPGIGPRPTPIGLFWSALACCGTCHGYTEALEQSSGSQHLCHLGPRAHDLNAKFYLFYSQKHSRVGETWVLVFIFKISFIVKNCWNFPRSRSSHADGPCSDPLVWKRSHMPQLRPHSQINNINVSRSWNTTQN